MNLTIIVDNFCGKMNLLSEHGFSAHLACNDGSSILIDAGQGLTLSSNAEKLNIDLSKINHLVLSHGHFDHTWGVPNVLIKTGYIPVWAHPMFDKPRYRKHQEDFYYIGSYIKKQDINFKPVHNITEIVPNVWAVEVPLNKRNQEYLSHTDHLMVYEADTWKIDKFEDDISLVVKGKYGYSVILGCAHAGIVNILNEISQQFNIKDFYTVVGGMHIGEESEDFCKKIIDSLLNNYNVQIWRPSHCSGFKGAAMLGANAPNVAWGSAGTVLEL